MDAPNYLARIAQPDMEGQRGEARRDEGRLRYIGPGKPSWREKIARQFVSDDDPLSMESERLLEGLIGSSGTGTDRHGGYADMVPGLGTAMLGVDSMEALAHGNGRRAVGAVAEMAIPFGISKGIGRAARWLDRRLPRWDPKLDKIIEMMKAHRAKFPGTYPDDEIAKISSGEDALNLSTRELQRASGSPVYADNSRGAVMERKNQEFLDYTRSAARQAQEAERVRAEYKAMLDRLWSDDPAKSEMARRELDAVLAKIQNQNGSASRMNMHGAGAVADGAAAAKQRRWQTALDSYVNAEPPPRNRLNMLAPLAAAPVAYQYDRRR